MQNQTFPETATSETNVPDDDEVTSQLQAPKFIEDSTTEIANNLLGSLITPDEHLDHNDHNEANDEVQINDQEPSVHQEEKFEKLGDTIKSVLISKSETDERNDGEKEALENEQTKQETAKENCVFEADDQMISPDAEEQQPNQLEDSAKAEDNNVSENQTEMSTTITLDEDFVSKQLLDKLIQPDVKPEQPAVTSEINCETEKNSDENKERSYSDDLNNCNSISKNVEIYSNNDINTNSNVDNNQNEQQNNEQQNNKQQNNEQQNNEQQNNEQQKDDMNTFATNPSNLDIRISNENSNKSSKLNSAKISPRTEFKRMIYGTPPPRRSYSSAMHRRQNYDSLANTNTVQLTADALLKGKPLKIEDPNVVAEIIDDLNVKKIEALAVNDYKQSKKIKDTIDNTRFQYRQHDRELLHKEVVRNLDEKNKSSIDAMTDAKERWKKKHNEQMKETKQALKDLQERHQEQHSQLEEEWVQPQKIRKFDKRSVMLLQNRQREQYMMLLEMYDEADQMKHINTQQEKAELVERKNQMNSHFHNARSNLIRKQMEETDKTQMQNEIEAGINSLQERKEIDVKTRRLQATQRTLDEEKDFDRFIAKKFKKASTTIVPNTVMVSREATDDIPPLPRGSLIPHTVSDMMNIRKRNIVTPLPLQPLSIKKYKTQKLVRNSK